MSAVPAISSQENTSPSTPSVLLVDDEPNVLNAVKRLLRPCGYEISTAESGEAAISLLEQRSFDVVVSDMRMPGMNGAQLLAEAHQRWPSMLRILLTGYADIDSAISAINSGGIFRYISKPWNDVDLTSTLQQAISISALQRDKLHLEKLTLQQNEALLVLNDSLELKVKARTEDLQIANQEISLAMEKLKKNFFATVQLMSNLIEMRAPALVGHGRRVADVAKKIAGKMSLPLAITNDIFLAGLLHDIGKIGYPDDMLLKPFPKMSGDEIGISKKHPVNGAAALMSLPDLRGVAEIIRCHHERWDGQGYPSNLSGLNIPIGARIVALANDYDAVQVGTLSAKRMNIEEAKNYIIEGRKFRYDPVVVDAFSELIGRAIVPTKSSEELRLNANQLTVGMRLARDLFSPDGLLLLSTEYVLDEMLITQLREFEHSVGMPLMICIKTNG
jgi:response regulator RpfG family c-di-GMP phosphodiesterase